ncbi:MAG: PTS mannose/fructose/sorbose transporter family subunit IID [Proteobacteria bacterium]|nr:PTS mannose/fructose/sorbose transporter family subunit IID [Pseudomonadota bacterium]
MSKVRNRDLIRVSLRLALLQSTWCEGGMQSVGLAYCLVPGLRRLSSSSEDLIQTIRRHGEPFNTHPFLVGAIVGATLRLEEDGRSPEEIASFLRSTMGPLAAVGDPFFRGALPIFVAALASFAAIVGGVLAGILTLLFLFNSIHIFVRLSGVYAGYHETDKVLHKVTRWLNPGRTKILETAAAIATGVVLILAAVKFGPSEPSWISIVLAAGGVVAAFGFVKWERSQAYAIPVTLAACFILEVLI